MTPRRAARLREQIRHSRARLMVRDPLVAMVLMYLRFVATKAVTRISTNGLVILFDPDWFQKLSREETDYILSHQVMHIVLEDTRRPAFFTGDRFHHACDIIASSILRDRGWEADGFSHLGMLPHQTYFPRCEGNELMPLQAYRAVPFDPGALKERERRRFQLDSDAFWGRDLLPEDAVLILFPGYEDSIEEPVKSGRIIRTEAEREDRRQRQLKHIDAKSGDDDSDRPANELSAEQLDAAIDRLLDMIETMESRDPRQTELVERIWNGVGSGRLEWKTILDAFLQEEVNDYSFLPPDRRYADSGFFLPDFNQTERSLKDVLFMVDASGSIHNDTIADIYAEICAAIEQYDGALQGKLGFFDTQVTVPKPFGSIQQLLKIRPRGNGGTDFGCIFRYVNRFFEKPPACIVIFTDGRGDYPAEEEALGVPVLWILYGGAPFPRWGTHARILT